MKVLSLLQPWASLVVTKRPCTFPDNSIKCWETRSWKPTERNLAIIQKHGMLIHASKKWGKQQKELMKQWPFEDFKQLIEPMPFGAIIGWVRVGRIFTTEQWKGYYGAYEDGAAERWAEEHQFGDYSPNRFAWEIADFKKFNNPIEINGALSLWAYNLPVKELS